jgi:hypothetical protein
MLRMKIYDSANGGFDGEFLEKLEKSGIFIKSQMKPKMQRKMCKNCYHRIFRDVYSDTKEVSEWSHEKSDFVEGYCGVTSKGKECQCDAPE